METKEGDETIEVREDIYKAAEAFDELVGGEGFLLAEELVKMFDRAGNEIMRKQWKAMSDYLKSREFAAAGTRVIILPETKS